MDYVPPALIGLLFPPSDPPLLSPVTFILPIFRITPALEPHSR